MIFHYVLIRIQKGVLSFFHNGAIIQLDQFNFDSIQINNSVSVANSAVEGLDPMNDPGWTISNMDSPYVKETTQLALVCWQKFNINLSNKQLYLIK